MPLFLENFDQWYEAYEIASHKEQYEQLLDIVSTPIDPTYADETELADMLLELQSRLESHGLLEEALSLSALARATACFL